MYAREIDGREFDFGVSGKLIRNVLVMYDRQTNSLWSQLIGESIEGDMIGTKLEFVPSWMTTWEEWQRMHPETLALNKGYAGSRDPYEFGYYDSNAAGVIGEKFEDDRLEVKEFVVGVELDTTAVAYPYRFLNEEPIVNDTISASGQSLLVVFDKDAATAAVFDRTLDDGTPLTFEAGENIDRMVDTETGTVWDRFAGTALEGELAGTELERIKSTTVFWFGWKDFFPETVVYGIDG